MGTCATASTRCAGYGGYMNTMLRTALGVAGVLLAAQASAQVTFYQGRDFRGPSFTADGPVWNLERYGFNDRASSAVVDNGEWQVCEDARFGGRCVVLQPGEYPSLREMGLNNMVSSVRPADRVAAYNSAPPPAAAPAYESRWYDVPVSSVHAVVGPPEQRCWVERQEVGGNNVGGAVVGGVIGGLSVTRSAPDAATRQRPSAARSPARRSATTSAAAAVIRRMCSAAPRRRAMRGPTTGT